MSLPQQGLSFEAQGQTWTVEFDFAAIETFERRADLSIVAAVEQLERGEPKVSVVVRLLEAGLVKHHPDIKADAALALLGDPAVRGALFGALNLAMPEGGEGGDGGQGEA